MKKHTIKPTKADKELNEMIALAEAEDKIVSHLGNLPPRVALLAALSLETILAGKWQIKQDRMLAMDDPREVICITRDYWCELNAVIKKVPDDIRVDMAALNWARRLLSKLPPDKAWWTMHLVRNYEKFRAGPCDQGSVGA